jgi:hypothetical protein
MNWLVNSYRIIPYAKSVGHDLSAMT